jgi:hypothetical protein
MPQLRFKSFLTFLVTLFLATAFSLGTGVRTASAAVLFEGWSKVLISGKHVGYVIQRYDFDEKKKEFRATHFLKTSPESGGLTESLASRSDASFKPLSYQYTSTVGTKPMLIDATFKGDQMTAIVTEGKDKKTIKNTMPKGTFLSGFLGYVMLQGKEGLKKGVKYEYQGILEESAMITKGEAYISEEETVSGIPAYRILNTINGSKFISLASHKAEILGTVSPSQGVQTVLVASMEEAIGAFGLNNTALTRLFGSVPKGKENEVARRSMMPAPKVPPTTPLAAGAAKPSDKTPIAPPVSAPTKDGAANVTSPAVTAPAIAVPAPTSTATPKPEGK